MTLGPGAKLGPYEVRADKTVGAGSFKRAPEPKKAS